MAGVFEIVVGMSYEYANFRKVPDTAFFRHKCSFLPV